MTEDVSAVERILCCRSFYSRYITCSQYQLGLHWVRLISRHQRATSYLGSQFSQAIQFNFSVFLQYNLQTYLAQLSRHLKKMAEQANWLSVECSSNLGPCVFFTRIAPKVTFKMSHHPVTQSGPLWDQFVHHPWKLHVLFEYKRVVFIKRLTFAN